jgi:hypothetical protein
MLTRVKMHQKATIWSALYRRFLALKGKISSDTINQPGNAMTMAIDIHEYWRELYLTLEPTVGRDPTTRPN